MNILPNMLSDHSVVKANISLKNIQTKATRWRFNTSLLNNDDFCMFFRRELHMFLSENAGSDENPVDPCILFNAVKGCIRNVSILFSSQLNKSRLRKIVELETKLCQLDQEQMLLGFS